MVKLEINWSDWNKRIEGIDELSQILKRN